MSYVREAIDPNGTLPQVDFNVYKVQNHDGYGVVREQAQIMTGSLVVGTCDLITLSPPYERKMHFDGITVEDEHIGDGYGLGAYVAAIERAHDRGLPFATQESTQSIHAKRIWELLAARGVAVVIEEFRDSIYEGKFEGKYIVPILGS